MGKIWRLLLLALLLNASLATMALARTVYLTNGGTIQAQKVWKEEGRIYLLLNRDSLIYFSPEEIDLKKTFSTQKVKQVAQAKRAPIALVVSPAPKSVLPAAAQSPAKVIPAPAEKKPAIAPAPKPVKSAVKKPATPVPPPAEETSLVDFALPAAAIAILLALVGFLWKIYKRRGAAQSDE